MALRRFVSISRLNAKALRNNHGLGRLCARSFTASAVNRQLPTSDQQDVSGGYRPVLTAETINPHLIRAEYAVRGLIPTRAAQIEAELRTGSTAYPFQKIIYSNIGNPQSLGQKPITFFRQVLSLLESDDLFQAAVDGRLNGVFPSDAIERARLYRDANVRIGAYSESQGVRIAREEVAAFIAQRDGAPCSPDDIFLTSGASEGVGNVLNALISGPEVGVMIPIPQYPLYSATITLNNGRAVPYYLNESANWDLAVDELRQRLENARAAGISVRAISVINPGNPTGQCLSYDSVRNIIEFAHSENLAILADEVYQENAYLPDFPFYSFKKVLHEMGPSYSQQELFSFHSLSKGMIGECGRRGGYMEVTNITREAREQLIKRASINLCSNVPAQIMTGMMCNPPKPGEPSYERYTKEVTDQKESLKRRAFRLASAFNDMQGITCNPPMGAMYLFPKIELSSAAVEAAAEAKLVPDTFYCLKLLEDTGVCVVPGSGFEQEPGTFHFRCTFLPPEEHFNDFVDKFKSFQQKWIETYGL